MKRFICTFLALFVFTFVISPASAQVKDGPLTVSAQLKTSAISPVPSFGSPEAVFFGDIKKDFGWFELYADIGGRMKDAHFWLTDVWFRFEPFGENFRVAADWSTFGQQYPFPRTGDKVWASKRYIAFEVWGKKKVGPVTLTGQAWYSHGVGERTLQGVFLFPSASTSVDLGSFTLTPTISPFYINFTDNNEGAFFYGKLSLSHKEFPVSLNVETVNPVRTAIPFVNQLSFGLVYRFTADG